MKKIIVTVLALLISVSLFAESETYLSLNVSFGSIGISTNKGYKSDPADELKFDFSLNGGGLDFQSYTFWNKQNYGLFTQLPISFGSYNFSKSKDTISGEKIESKTQNFYIVIAPIVGIGFKKSISDKWLFLSGVGTGMEFTYHFYKYDSDSFFDKQNKYNLSFHILNNLDFKYLINEKISFDIGLNTTLTFAKFSVFPKTDYSSTPQKTTIIKEWVKSYFSIGSAFSLGVSFLVD